MYQKLSRPSGTTLAQLSAKLVAPAICRLVAVLAGILVSALTSLWSAQSAGREHSHLLIKYNVGSHSEMRIHTY